MIVLWRTKWPNRSTQDDTRHGSQHFRTERPNALDLINWPHGDRQIIEADECKNFGPKPDDEWTGWMVITASNSHSVMRGLDQQRADMSAGGQRGHSIIGQQGIHFSRYTIHKLKRRPVKGEAFGSREREERLALSKTGRTVREGVQRRPWLCVG